MNECQEKELRFGSSSLTSCHPPQSCGTLAGLIVLNHPNLSLLLQISSWCLSINESRPEATGQGSPLVQSIQVNLFLPAPTQCTVARSGQWRRSSPKGWRKQKEERPQTCWKARKLLSALVFQSTVYLCSP